MYGGYAKRNCSSTGKSEGRDVLPKRLQAKNGAGTGKTRINAILTPPDTRRDTSLLHNMSLTGAFILQVRLHTINRSKRIRPMQADRLQAVHITCLNTEAQKETSNQRGLNERAAALRQPFRSSLPGFS